MQPRGTLPGGITVLVAGLDGPEFARLHAILEGAGCRVLVARTAHQSHTLAGMASVAICADRLPDGTWRDLLSHSRPQPALIVTASSADGRLWGEVLNLGGYDVLAQPFSPGEVLWSVQRAHEASKAAPLSENLQHCALLRSP